MADYYRARARGSNFELDLWATLGWFSLLVYS